MTGVNAEEQCATSYRQRPGVTAEEQSATSTRTITLPLLKEKE
jgi:hypothetical protein